MYKTGDCEQSVGDKCMHISELNCYNSGIFSKLKLTYLLNAKYTCKIQDTNDMK